MASWKVLVFTTLFCLAAVPVQALQLLTEENPPANFTRDGMPAGVATELVQEMLRRQNMDVPLEFLPWARAYAMATTLPDVGLFATARLPERENLFHWVGPLVRFQWVLVAKAGSGIRLETLEDARQYRIATLAGDAREQFLRHNGFTNLDPSSSNLRNLEKLMHGRVDLLVCNQHALPLLLAEANAEAHAAEHHARDELDVIFTLRTIHLYLAFSRGVEAGVVEGFQRALASMREDGAFDAIHAQWLPGETPPRDVPAH